MAMNAYRNYSNNTSALAKNLERLSSGYKINRAGDDAAGLAISEKMRAQITGLDAAQKNVKDGISLVNTAEGAMQEIQDMLNRMVYLATQSSNGTYDNEVDRKNLQQEVDQLKEEINRIADSANFNGIKLLDGSLEATGGAKTVSVSGLTSTKSAATKGVFTMSAPYTAKTQLFKPGGTINFSVSLDDGTSVNTNFTIVRDAEKGKNFLEAADGTRYAIADTATEDISVTVNEMDAAIKSELSKSSLKNDFDIDVTAGKFKLTSLKEGDDQLKVKAFDLTGTTDGITAWTAADTDDVGLIATGGLGEGREINASSLTLYDGKNYEDAVFEINGKKFVMVTDVRDGSSNTFLNATQGLGSDVTILVADDTTKNGLKAADENFAQNIAKIAEVTGLTVTDAVNETTYGAAANSGVAPGAGIRLSAGKAATGGLVLQIGDTSESFNQLRVDIKDMHTKSLGIDAIDISRPEGAQAAIDVVKAAINTVSAVRGKLGAISNRLDHTANNRSVMRENITDAESAIRDTDIAEEMMSYTKNNILVQSAQAMLAQANQVPQGVLQLLQ